MRNQIRMPRQSGGEPVGEIRQQQMGSGQIDADREAQPRRMPSSHVIKRMRDDPLAGADLELGSVHEREKVRREKQSALGVLPADQGLGTDDIAGVEIHLGLVMERQLMVLDRLAKTFQIVDAGEQRLVLRDIEDVDPFTAELLSAIHRPCGMPQPGLRIAVVFGKDRHAQAGEDTDPVAVEGEWCRKLAQ